MTSRSGSKNRGKASPKKTALVVGGGLVLLLLAMQRRAGKGDVLLGPIVELGQKFDIRLASAGGKVTEADVQRLTLALIRCRQLMGADPNTLASRQPNATELSYIEQTLASNRVLSQMTNGALPYPTIEEKRLALAKKLPGDTLQIANKRLYALLGVDSNYLNEATVPLTSAIETAARSIIALWRPYSQEAVDTLFVLLDESRSLASGVA